LDQHQEAVEDPEQDLTSRDASYVLRLDEIANLAAEGGNAGPDEHGRLDRRAFGRRCSAYLLEPDRLTSCWRRRSDSAECIGTLRMGIHEGRRPGRAGPAGRS
jgi:hypothetical protein